jgi:hypothetical protein
MYPCERVQGDGGVILRCSLRVLLSDHFNDEELLVLFLVAIGVLVVAVEALVLAAALSHLHRCQL